MGAGGGGEEAAEDGADRPADVLHGLEQRVGGRQVLVRDEVGDAGIDGRAEEAVRDAGDGGERDDRAGTARERQREEDRGAEHVGADHEVAPRQPVEERAEREADDDGRQVGDDEDGADPEARVRPVLDVDRERDRRQKGADRRPEGRDRQQAKTRVAERQQLTADSCQGAPDANTLSGALRDA